eukprot:scaffold20061_cov29-Tisochrysis_lutea.AAC.3
MPAAKIVVLGNGISAIAAAKAAAKGGEHSVTVVCANDFQGEREETERGRSGEGEGLGGGMDGWIAGRKRPSRTACRGKEEGVGNIASRVECANQQGRIQGKRRERERNKAGRDAV